MSHHAGAERVVWVWMHLLDNMPAASAPEMHKIFQIPLNYVEFHVMKVRLKGGIIIILWRKKKEHGIK